MFGFMKECLASYDEVTFSMFVEVFRYLPLATIINGQVCIPDNHAFWLSSARLIHFFIMPVLRRFLSCMAVCSASRECCWRR